MKTQCETCAHTNVCRNIKQYEELAKTLNDLAKLMENQVFNITATCRFYWNEKN